MPIDHIVQPGEHLVQIARKHGFTNTDAIWNAPENAQLKKERENPNVLNPGDKLVIPDKEFKELDKATGKRHTFELRDQRLMLRVALHGLRNVPLSGHEGTMVVESDSKDFKTEDDGMIERDIAPDARSGTLIDRGPPPPPTRSASTGPSRSGSGSSTPSKRSAARLPGLTTWDTTPERFSTASSRPSRSRRSRSRSVSARRSRSSSATSSSPSTASAAPTPRAS